MTSVDALVRDGVLVEHEGSWTTAGPVEADSWGVPPSLRQMIEHQIERLQKADRQLLETASVGGSPFSSELVAGVTELDASQCEERCQALAQREGCLQFHANDDLAAPVRPNYAFAHSLYGQVLYERLAPTRRATLHRRFGRALEEAYGEQQVNQLAAELAVHFEAGLDTERAVKYLLQAGILADRRFATVEGAAHFSKGLALVSTLPQVPGSRRARATLAGRLGQLEDANRGDGR